MIDWCKSNKNIALFITLSSKDSSNKKGTSIPLFVKDFSVSVDYLSRFVHSSGGWHFPQALLVEHLQCSIHIPNGSFIALLPEFILQNTHFFKSLYPLNQTFHADRRTGIGVNQISVTSRPRSETTVLQRILHPAIQSPTEITVQIFLSTMPRQPFGFGRLTESERVRTRFCAASVIGSHFSGCIEFILTFAYTLTLFPCIPLFIGNTARCKQACMECRLFYLHSIHLRHISLRIY